MSVISIRLNEKEEKVLRMLVEYYNEDRSTLIKHSLQEMYEDIIDMKEIEQFEYDEKAGKTKFLPQDRLKDFLQ